MALLTPTSVVAGAGTLLSLVAANSSDTVAADDSCWLHVKNASGGAITVTISDGGNTPGGNPANVTARSVAAGTERLFDLRAAYNDITTGLTTITYSATASVTAGVFRN